MNGVVLGRVFILNKGMGTAYSEPEHPKHISVILDRARDIDYPIFTTRDQVIWCRSKPKPRSHHKK